MRGVRQALILAGLILLGILILFYISGCSKCGIQKDKSTDLRELKKMAPWVEQQSYTFEERQVEKKCHTVVPTPEETDETEWMYGLYKFKLGPVEWVDQPPVLGQTNWIRRKLTVYNGYPELKMIYLDKLDYYDGELIRRSKNPMKLLIEPMSSREVPLMKDTQYDPKINIGADIANKTLDNIPEPDIMIAEPQEICEEEVTTVTKEGFKNISKGTREVVQGYREILRIHLTKDC